MADNVTIYSPSGGAASITYDTKDTGSSVQRPRVEALTPIVTVSTDVTRPADTNAYVAGDAFTDSTSAPTSGGFTFTSAGRISGGSGVIIDAMFVTSSAAATPLQGELWVFDTSVTNVNDNAAFSITDAEAKTLVAKIPFTMVAGVNNSICHIQNLNIGFTCVGTANLRFIPVVRAAYTPISAEVLTSRLKIEQR